MTDDVGTGMLNAVMARQHKVNLRVTDLCGPRFVAIPGEPFPADVVVYRVQATSVYQSECFMCSPGDQERWAEALRTYLDTLSRALEILTREHRGNSRVDLRTGTRSYTHVELPAIRFPGWRRRMAERSARAQRTFLAVAAAAAAEYEPVRVEIESRLEALRAEQEARRAEWRRIEDAMSRVAWDIAARPVWAYGHLVGKPRTIFVYRLDVAPKRPVQDIVRESERPLDAQELEDALLELAAARDENGRRRRKRRVRWDARAREQVERDCTEAGQEIPDFDWWWEEVAQGVWRTKTASSGPVVVHVSSHHSSNGVGGMNGGSGGFDGGSGGGAYGGFGGCF